MPMNRFIDVVFGYQYGIHWSVASLYRAPCGPVQGWLFAWSFLHMPVKFVTVSLMLLARITNHVVASHMDFLHLL